MMFLLQNTSNDYKQNNCDSEVMERHKKGKVIQYQYNICVAMGINA